MKKALLCVGNELRGDDGVAIEVGRLVEQFLPQWKVFFGYDTPENEFTSLRQFAPDVIVVVDAMSGFKEGTSNTHFNKLFAQYLHENDFFGYYCFA